MSDLTGYVLALIQEHVGTQQATPAEAIAAKAAAFYNVSISGREIRQVIHDLRQAENPICSGVSGFFWPACLQDVHTCVDLLFRGEAKSMLKTARVMRQAGNRMFGGQGKLL